MALAFRLASNQFRSQLLRNEKSKLLNFVRPVTIKPITASEPADEGYDERNARLGRPQSPHLTIYKFQVTSVLSITHRATGIALSGYAMALGVSALVMPLPIEHYITALEALQLGAPLLTLTKFTLSFPLTYHFWNGIRHLLWDTGKFLSIKEVYTTGYAMLALSVASAIALSLM